MKPTISIVFRAPATELLPFISTYYEFSVTGDEPIEDYLHPEWANIRMALDKPWIIGPDNIPEQICSGMTSVLHGPTSKLTYIKGSGASFGIGILPQGWMRLIKAPAHEYANRIVPLEPILSDAGGSAWIKDIFSAPNIDTRKAIADKFLIEQISQGQPYRNEEKVVRLLALIANSQSTTVEQLTDALGLTQSQLARLCKRSLGFTPKLLLRRQRFLRMLGTLHARPYSEWRDFIDPQYTDQSHMVRDFQYFMRMSPSAYFRLPRPILAAAASARAEMFGQPLQGLHHKYD